MLRLAVGTDLVEIRRVGELVARYGTRFTDRVFTVIELADSCGRVESLAARWAAKEAVAKALGTGFGAVSPRDIEVVRDEKGRPCLRLYRTAQAEADEQGLTRWALSLAHDGGLAVAYVMAM